MNHEETLELLRQRLQTVAEEARTAEPDAGDEPAVVLRKETIELADTARAMLQRLPGGLGHIVLGSLPGDDTTGDWGTLVDHAVHAVRQRNWPIARGSVQRIVHGLTNLPPW